MTDLSPPPGTDEELWTTALHEAGHVAYALAVGIEVTRVDVIPADGRLGCTVTVPLHVPAEAECQPGSRWIDLQVKRLLAGDRAVRLLAPHYETSGGGPTSDYHRANAYLQAVYPSGQVEGHLDRCCRDLDDFFKVPTIRHDVAIVAEALLEHRSLAGDEVRALVTGGQCGAYTEDFTTRCTKAPHAPVAPHHARKASLPTSRESWCWLDWSEDRTPLSKRTARSKRVLRLYNPERFPSPRRDPTIDDLPELWATINDPTQPESKRSAARTKLLNLMASRVRPEIRQSLPPPAGHERDGLKQHSDECGEPVAPDPDGDYWCGACGFELLNPDRARHPKRIYQIVEWRLAVRTDASTQPAPVPVATSMTFSTAQEAQTCLRLTKDDPVQKGAIRLTLPVRQRKPAAKKET